MGQVMWDVDDASAFDVICAHAAAYTHRPQNDGPAIRVTTLLLLAKKSSPRYVEGTLRPAILRDLDYIARVWEEPCFDLW